MKNKQIIIHVGPAKTGTSALQYFLLRNCDELKKVGYYYPNHRLDENDISGGHGSPEFDIKKTINEFLESNYHTLILSAESFFKDSFERDKSFSLARFFFMDSMSLVI